MGGCLAISAAEVETQEDIDICDIKLGKHRQVEKKNDKPTKKKFNGICISSHCCRQRFTTV